METGAKEAEAVESVSDDKHWVCNVSAIKDYNCNPNKPFDVSSNLFVCQGTMTTLSSVTAKEG